MKVLDIRRDAPKTSRQSNRSDRAKLPTNCRSSSTWFSALYHLSGFVNSIHFAKKKQFSVDSRFDLNTCWRDCCIWPLKHDICRGQVTNQDFIGLLYTFVFLQSNSEWNVFRFSSGTLLLEKEKWCHREWMGQPNLSKRALVKLQQDSSRWRGDCQNDTHCPVRTEHKQLRKKKRVSWRIH